MNDVCRMDSDASMRISGVTPGRGEVECVAGAIDPLAKRVDNVVVVTRESNFHSDSFRETHSERFTELSQPAPYVTDVFLVGPAKFSEQIGFLQPDCQVKDA